MKKVLALILTLTLVFCCVPFGAFNIHVSAATSGTTGDCTWTLNGTVLTISGTGAMGFGSPWHDSITEVIIEDGVTSISRSAFKSCDSLESVSIPDSVTNIGDDAFAFCTSLKSISIPNSVTSIDYHVFYYCTLLESISIPNSVTNIEAGAFSRCSSLKSISIPNSVTNIDSDAFSYCAALKSITLPNALKNISEWTFSYCTKLESVTIPKSVTSIEDCAFHCCDSLKTVNITDLKAWCEIDFGESFANPVYFADCLYLNGEKLSGDIVIPDGVKTIPAYTFKNSRVTSVIIPDGVTSIGNSAFDYCPLLKSISIPNSVTYLGQNAFNECYALEIVNITDLKAWCEMQSMSYSPMYWADNLYFNGEKLSGDIVIPYGVKIIPESAFKNSDITSVTIPDGVTDIDYYAFRNCTSLESITIPASVTSIYLEAFENCSSLKDVFYCGTEADREKITIEGANTSLENATWHYNYISQPENITSDVNGDGESNASDLALLKKYIAGLLNASAMASCNPDVYGDNVINEGDLAQLKKMIAGLI